MQLPIDLIPDTRPPKFKWIKVVDGQRLPMDGPLPASVEGPVITLINMVKQLMQENRELRRRVVVLEEDAPKRRRGHRDVESV